MQVTSEQQTQFIDRRTSQDGPPGVERRQFSDSRLHERPELGQALYRVGVDRQHAKKSPAPCSGTAAHPDHGRSQTQAPQLTRRVGRLIPLRPFEVPPTKGKGR